MKTKRIISVALYAVFCFIIIWLFIFSVDMVRIDGGVIPVFATTRHEGGFVAFEGWGYAVYTFFSMPAQGESVASVSDLVIFPSTLFLSPMSASSATALANILIYMLPILFIIIILIPIIFAVIRKRQEKNGVMFSISNNASK